MAVRGSAGLDERKRRLLAIMRGERETERADEAGVSLVPFTTGDTDPLALVHPVDGGLFCYTGLVRTLPAGLPVLGISAEHSRFPVTADFAPIIVEQLATRYLDRLAAARTRCVALVGWSSGGVIAFEMARQAAQRGQAPKVLVLIDAMPVPGELRSVRDLPRLLGAFAANLARWSGLGEKSEVLAERITDALVECGSGPVEDALDTVAELLGRAGVPVDRSPDTMLADFRRFAAVLCAVDRYCPGPNPVPTVLIRASLSPVRRHHWDQATIRAEHVIEADHYSLLRPPAVEKVARLLADLGT